MPTGKKLVDVTVIRYVDDSPRASVEDTKSYALSQWQGVLRRDREGFVRWCEDENGNVLESHDDFWPPTKPDDVVLVGGNLAELLGDSLD